MPISFKEVQYKNFGSCIRISNESCTVIVTADFGPRIIYYGMNDGINLFREDSERESCEWGELFDSYYYPGAAWYHYGGHRLWYTPESNPQTYYPDNDAVAWTINENVLVMTPPKQIKNEVQFTFKIELAPKGTCLRVGHEIGNCAALPRELAPWTVTQMAPCGTAVIPLPEFLPGCLAPRQKLLLWDNTSVADSRLQWLKDSLWISHSTEPQECMKIGVHNTGGKVFYYIDGYMCTISFPFTQDKHYPDGGASFELYSCNQFIELETLGETVCLLPGEKVYHEIFFHLNHLNHMLEANPAKGEGLEALKLLFRKEK